MKKNYLFLCLYLFVDYQKKKKKSRRNLSLPYYKELKLVKLKYHRRKKKALFTKNLSLVSLSIVLHGTRVYQARVPCGIFQYRNPRQHKFFYMKL